MKHFQLITSGIDVKPLLAELEANPTLWDQHKARTTAPGTPHRASQDIWVRFRDIGPFERGERPWSEVNDEHLSVNYPAWYALPSLHPIVFDLMRRVEGLVLGGILITKIPSGGRIEPHIDRGWHPEYYQKFYLSLKSERGAVFGCDHRGVKEELNPLPGDVWRFNNSKLHYVRNDSPGDRMTAICCIRTEMFEHDSPSNT